MATAGATKPAVETLVRCPHCDPNPQPGSAPGWHKTIGPLPVLTKMLGINKYGPPEWMENLYRYWQENGTWAYVAEPYEIDVEPTGLDRIWAYGFSVSITAAAAVHAPGQTIAITIVAFDDLVDPTPPPLTVVQ